jgi:hypothetical protein
MNKATRKIIRNGLIGLVGVLLILIAFVKRKRIKEIAKRILF